MADDDPFQDDEVANPFADPSVQDATGPVDMYNPFDNGTGSNASTRSSGYNQVDSSGATGSTAYESSYATSSAVHATGTIGSGGGGGGGGSSYGGGSSMSDDEIKRREEALRHREAELARREAELDDREQQMRESGFVPPNWPSKCAPILYHSIKDEIPVRNQPLVNKFYLLCLFTWLCLFWNWLVVVAIWLSPSIKVDSMIALWASLYFVLGVMGAWRLWYRSLYFAIRDKSTRKWLWFFAMFLSHMAYVGVIGSGIPGVAGSGIWLMLDLLANKHTSQGIMCLVGFALWCVNFLFSLVMLKQSHTVWKKSGGEDEAKRDLAKAAAEHYV